MQPLCAGRGPGALPAKRLHGPLDKSSLLICLNFSYMEDGAMSDGTMSDGTMSPFKCAYVTVVAVGLDSHPLGSNASWI